jgi:hypothetical protein
MNGNSPNTHVAANPFWVCLLVFLALAVDASFRLAKAWEQRGHLQQARVTQKANVERAANALAQTDKLEIKLQAVSIDLLQLGRTNATAAQLIREFNISWTPGTETAAPASLSATNPSSAPRSIQ